ncbi:GNAT family N-acetyltransferase [Anatilimnocola sp. NA78]|uniref:GNAT family N-acetyltransferase n=1 Tax=Anatilimnocola sp. NA78 TaxID=3415683 RepID=UPI003CE4AB46
MKLPEITVEALQQSTAEPSEALQLASTAWSVAERSVQIAAVLRTAGQQPPRFKLVAARENGKLVGTVLAESLPGRSAVVMAPQVIAEPVSRGAIAVSLLQAMNRALQAEGVLLAQALTPKRSDEVTQQFIAAEYHLAGDLLYLAADLDDLPTPEASIAEFHLVSHDPTDIPRWAAILERTYIGTLDCPAVDGLRPTAEVLKGYRDIGRPRDDWWYLARFQGRDVGCLLLAEHGEVPQVELVYMGLVPEVRGRGWGLQLVQHAVELAKSNQARHLLLSVDADNAPAIHHYHTAGLRIWEQRAIWIKSLSADASQR